jgi:Flp pilus assembly protein TadG
MSRLTKSQQGSSIVEFSIVLPLLLLLICMIAEYGIKFYRLNALTKSVQVAARYLSDKGSTLTPPTVADKTAAINLALCGSTVCTGINPILPAPAATILVHPEPTAGHVLVTGSYASNMVLGNTLNAFMSMATGSSSATTMTLEASSVMRYTQ